MLPPDEEDVSSHIRFWRSLIEWAADKRTALGPETHDVVINHFTASGWPNYEPPFCPHGLSGLAASALNRLLASRREAISMPRHEAALDPKYVRDDDGALAIAFDVTSEWEEPPVALASNPRHWEKSVDEVVIAPPPPSTIQLIYIPKALSRAEQIARLQRRLRNRRLTIVGGLCDRVVCTRLEADLGLRGSDLRWIESEPGKDPETDRLKGMQGHRDVLCCVLGTEGVLGLGHGGSQSAVEHARDRGVPHCSVRTPSEVIDAVIELIAP